MDALGDPGRQSGRPIYAIALVWVGQSDHALEELFTQARSELGLHAAYEFHARQVTKLEWKRRMPQRFFALLQAQGLEAEVWCAGIRKTRSHLPLAYDGKRLVNELTARTLLEMPRERTDGVVLTIDERVHDKKAATVVREMRTYINGALRPKGYSIGSVRARESHTCAGIQLADYLVTAVMKPWTECRAELAEWRSHERWW